VGNLAQGGAGAAGAPGGTAFGGGIFNGKGTLTVSGSTITGNQAQGGASGGLGWGGGVFNLGTIMIEDTAIFGNKADLFPDCFGC
jgi:hypothetical protein